MVDTNLAFLIKRNNRQMEGLTKFLKVLVRLELRKMTNFGLLHGKVNCVASMRIPSEVKPNKFQVLYTLIKSVG